MELYRLRLQELRIEKGLSLVQLASETGLSKSAISYWENGDRIPNAQAIVILAKYFDISTDYLLGVKDWE